MSLVIDKDRGSLFGITFSQNCENHCPYNWYEAIDGRGSFNDHIDEYRKSTV